MADIVVQIDFDALTIGDLEILESARGGSISTKELLDLFDRVVVGGARSLPMRALPQVVEAIREAVDGAANPTTGTATA